MEEDVKKNIQDAINSGATEEEVKEILKKSGWNDDKIKTIFSELSPKEPLQGNNIPTLPSPPPPSSPPSEQLPKIPQKPVDFPKPELTGEPIGSYCERCGTALKKNATYCPYCGKASTSSTEPRVQPFVQEPAYSGQQQQYPQETSQQSKDKSGLATASLVLGILSIFLGPLTGIIGLILGIKGLKSPKRSLAIAGIVLSALCSFLIVIPAAIVLVSLNSAQTRARDARITSAMNQLRTSSQAYYSSSYSYKDSYDGSYKGLEDDPGILKIKNDIEENGGSSFSMNVASDKYCAEVMLPSKKWWCVDSSLMSQQYEEDPICSKTNYACE